MPCLIFTLTQFAKPLRLCVKEMQPNYISVLKYFSNNICAATYALIFSW